MESQVDTYLCWRIVRKTEGSLCWSEYCKESWKKCSSSPCWSCIHHNVKLSREDEYSVGFQSEYFHSFIFYQWHRNLSTGWSQRPMIRIDGRKNRNTHTIVFRYVSYLTEMRVAVLTGRAHFLASGDIDVPGDELQRITAFRRMKAKKACLNWKEASIITHHLMLTRIEIDD